MSDVELKALPPVEAIRHFERKGYQVGFAWQDVWQEEHAKAFTVAKAMRVDILQDIRAAMDAAIREGTTLQDFQKRLRPLLEEKGWWGKQRMVDLATGELKTVQLGSPRRLEIIFRTNMRTSYAAGKWERIQRTKAALPMLKYMAVLDDHTRDQHRAWHGTILPVDDPFWSTHYPPNGWNCRCGVMQMTRRQAQAAGGASKRPEGGSRSYVNPRTGEVITVPDGIDPGFGYNVGEAHIRALTPRPSTSPLAPAAPIGPVAPPLSAARPAPADRLAQLTGEEAARGFLQSFGAAPGKVTFFRDALGDTQPIDAGLFGKQDGTPVRLPAVKARGLALAADTIRDPAEIWHLFREVQPGRFMLIRRYVGRWQVAGRDAPVDVAVDMHRDQWSWTTSLEPETDIGPLRGGSLAYTRPDR